MQRISETIRLDALLEPFAGKTWDSPRGPVNYSLLGEARNGTVLLIPGLGMQRTEWSPELIAGLHAAGYATLIADNRDSGLTHLAGTVTQPSPPRVSCEPGVIGGRAPRLLEYTLQDLAADLRELVLHLDIGPVHVMGMSMGGMIAQHLALLAPSLVLSLTSLMSTTGARPVGRPQQESKWVFLTPAPTESRDAFLEYALRYHRALAGPHFVDVDRATALAAVSWERGIRPEGTARQLAAIQADGDRTERLAAVTVPTLVVHGDADPLIDVSGGVATAEAIPGAELVTIAGMGHSVPWECAGELTERVVAHFAEANADGDDAHPDCPESRS